ncbi:hypothetical protein DXG01_016581, partial [Tephrocybe rancida]
MTCAKCGEAPEDVIWDGVTVGFSKKHVLDTLRPPTISHKDAPTRLNEYNARQQVLLDGKLRKRLRTIVTGAGRYGPPLQDVGEGKKKKADTTKKDEAAKQAEVDRLEDVPHVLIELRKIS